MGKHPGSVAVLAALVGLSLPGVAHARKQTDHRYVYEQVWSAAVRMVRVDLRYPIDDQDPSIGYVLFQYQDRGRAYPGSIELVRTEVEGVEYVRTVVQIPSMPSYVEQMMLDRLGRKLRAEFGDPPERPRQPTAPAQPPPNRDRDRDRTDEAPEGDADDTPGEEDRAERDQRRRTTRATGTRG
jgi:hypothetical protein